MNSSPFDPTGLPQTGDIIAGKYQVESVLGQGGMGVVVAARHLGLRQRVAIKCLLPEGLRMPGARERFLREARAAAAIQSEHVARVIDMGVLPNGAPFLVMEHLTGTDLGGLFRARGRLPIPEAVDILLQACAAIAEAHALGIVHRDLKPQNLFLAQRAGGAPVVKVLDFGLAMSADDSAQGGRLTTTSLVVGSPQYMSPEQIRSLKYVDARTDIWALGVILYQLLAGRRPFEGKSMAVVYESILTHTPPPLAMCRFGTPPELDALVMRCLEKDPARRVQSVAELVQGLRPFASNRASSSDGQLVAAPSAGSPVPPPPARAARETTSATTREPTTLQFKGRLGASRARKTAIIAVVSVIALLWAIVVVVVVWFRG
jgi:serine/threonine protein kinase